MKPVIIIAMAFILITGISITSISAQSNYEIPSWVKGIAGFWAEDKISDAEFGEGLTFLINSGIIDIPKVEQLEFQIKLLEEENDKLRADLAKAYDRPESDFSKPFSQKCDESYPDVCIEEYPPNLNCGDIKYANFRVISPDPHGFDRDGNGIGCEVGSPSSAHIPSTHSCDESYPDVCIIPYPPDLNCGEIGYSNFRVIGNDPHGFDRDNDGIGCES